MEVKAILNKIKKETEEEKRELFFALEIGEKQVTSALWAIEAGVVKILVIGETQAWEDKDRFLAAVDMALSYIIYLNDSWYDNTSLTSYEFPLMTEGYYWISVSAMNMSGNSDPSDYLLIIVKIMLFGKKKRWRFKIVYNLVIHLQGVRI